MVKQISIKTKLGWVSAYESSGKIFRIKFGKLKKQTKSKILEITYLNSLTKKHRISKLLSK